jgi:hypothetical protein
MVAKDGAAGFSGEEIAHVDDVKKENGMGGGVASGLEVGDVGFNSGTGEVDDGVKATGDADTKLALGEEVGGKVGGGVFEDGRGKEAAPGETNAKGAELGEVGGFLVEGGEVVAAEGISEGGGEGPKAKIALEFDIFSKVGASGGCSGVGGVGGSLKQDEEVDGVGVVGKRAGRCELADGMEAGKEVGVSEGEGAVGEAADWERVQRGVGQ